MPDTGLPPLVASIIGDVSDALSAISELEAALEAFAGKDYIAELDVNMRQVSETLGEADGLLDQWGNRIADATAGVSLDTADFAAINAALSAFASERIDGPTLVPQIDQAALIAALAAAKTTAGAQGIAATAGITLPVGGGGGGGGGGFWEALGFGTAGSRLPWLGRGGLGLAGFGTLGALAGLGPESVITAGLGIAGSGLGALAGGGALALGSAGVAGVGMGTDLAGIGQAAGDIKNVTAAQNALTQAVAVYGPTSTEAATAQKQLNYTLSSFSPVAQQAVLQAANAIQSFKTMFDQVSGAAEKTGAQIITQFIQLGQTFLPTIGKFAAENMKIIQTGLQPLIQWLGTTGLQIFTQLEQVFQQHLPAAVHAFDQGLELLIRTLGFLAPKTGGFITYLDNLFTRLNGSEWGKFTGEIDKAIHIFDVWKGFIKAVGDAIYELFHHDAGTGTAIIQSLTDMIDKFNKWAATVAGGDKLHNLLEAHKQEILSLLKLLPTFISLFGQIDLTVAPVLMKLVTLLADVANALFHVPFVGQILEWGVALAFLSSKIGPLGWAFGKLGPLIGELFMKLGSATLSMLGFDAAAEATAGGVGILDAAVSALAAVGILALAVGLYELIHHFGVLHGLMIAGAAAVGVLTAAFIVLDTVPIVALIAGIGLAVAGLVAAIIELVKHFHEVVDFLGGPWGTAISAAIAVVFPFTGIPMLIIGHWRELESFFKTLWAGIKAATADFVGFFTAIPGEIVGAWHDVVSFFDGLGDAIGNGLGAIPGLLTRMLLFGPEMLAFFAGMGVKMMIQLAEGIAVGAVAVFNFFIALPGRLLGYMSAAASWLLSTGSMILDGLWHGITTGAVAVWNFFLALPGRVASYATTAGTWLLSAGTAVLTGMWNGIVAGATAIWNFFTGLSARVAGYFSDATHWLTSGGSATISGLWNGIVTGWKVVTSWFAGLPAWAAHVLDGCYNWLIDAGKQVINGLLDGIKTAWHDVQTWISHAAGDVIGWFKKGFNIASPSQLMADQVGRPIVEGITTGMQSGASAAAATAKQISDNIAHQFGSLAATGPAAAAVSNLKTIFSNLAGVFTNLATTASQAPQVAAHMATVAGALRAMASAMPQVTHAIDTVTAAFSGFTQSKAIQSIGSIFNQISNMFGNLGKAVHSASSVSAASIQTLLTALSGLAANAPKMVGAINSLVHAFQILEREKALGGELKTLSQIFSDLANVFTHLGAASKSSSDVTAASLTAIVVGLRLLDDQSPDIVAAVKGIEHEFSNLGNTKSLNAQLQSLSQLFTTLGTVFTNVAKTSQAAGSITPAALALITTALQKLGSVIQQLPALVEGASTATINAFVNLGNSIAHYIQGTMMSQMTLNGIAVGQAITLGIINGIDSKGSAVSQAATSAVTNAVNAAKAAAGVHSPSTVFHNIGADMMQGLANGILGNAGLASGALGQIRGSLGGIALTGGAGAGIAPVSAGYGGSTTQTITIQQPVQVVLNGQVLGTAMQNILLRMARSQGNLWAGYGGTNPVGTATAINPNAIAR